MIRVSVVAPGLDRTNYRLRYRDPLTRKQHWRTAKTTDKRDAEREAARWELDLNSGKQAIDSKILWKAFRERYEAEALPALAEKTGRGYRTAMNLFESLIGVYRLAGITSATLSEFAAKLRPKDASGRCSSENSIKSYLNQIRAVLGWAVQQKLLAAVPNAPRIKRVRTSDSPMKGRGLTDDEFKTLLAAVAGVVGERAATSWSHWLTGLWWSGLRLEESLELSWELSGKLSVDLSGKFPMLRVRRHWEKGHKDRLLPVAPEFGDFLRAIPAEQQVGSVFRLYAVDCPAAKGGRSRSLPGQIDAEWAGTICRRIGKAAAIVVDISDAGRIKYASAHDLRRSFGSRWAMRVMPPVLKELMRHEDIKTTMKYYVGYNAERTAEAAYAALRASTTPVGGEAAKGSVGGSVAAKAGRKTKANKAASANSETN